MRTCIAAVGFAAAVLSVGVPAPAQETGRAPAPEFTYGSATDRALIARIRQQVGTGDPPAIRLEGTLQWRGASERQRWGVTLRWPALYQQRTANVIHTLENDAYRTNAGTPPSVHEVARENVRNRFGDISLLLLARPHISGMAISVESGPSLDAIRWDTACEVARRTLPFLLDAPRKTALNVNIPGRSFDEIQGVRVGRISAFGPHSTGIEHVEPGLFRVVISPRGL